MTNLPENPRINFLARSAELHTVIGNVGNGDEIMIIVDFENNENHYAVIIPAELARDIGSSLIVRGCAAKSELQVYLDTGRVPEE